MKPVYRVEIRAPRLETVGSGTNPTETAIFMPPAGGPHRDWFRMATAPIGYGIELDGTITSYARRSTMSSWPSGNISIELLLRVDDPVRDAGIVSYAVAGDFNHVLIFLRNSAAAGVIEFAVAGGAGGANFTNAAVVDGKWHHLVWTRTAAGAAISYLDGVQQVSSSGVGTAITGSGYLYLGQEQDSLGAGLDANQALDGAVDAFKVYSRVLTPQEVAERYRGIIASDANKVVHWDFDDGYGFRDIDLSGTGNHAELLDVTFTNDTPITWKPYLGVVKGRRGRLDPLSKKVDAGQLALNGLDRRLGTVDVERWLTGFIGDGRARNAYLALKTIVQQGFQQTDGTLTMDAEDYFTGRVESVGLDGALWFTTGVRDNAADLDADIFVGIPHVDAQTYANVPALIPLGLRSTYANFTLVNPIRSKVKYRTTDGKGGMFTLDTGRRENIITAQMYRSGQISWDFALGGPGTVSISQNGIDRGGCNGFVGDEATLRRAPFRLRVKNLTTGLSGKLWCLGINPNVATNVDAGKHYQVGVHSLWVRELPASDPDFIAFATVNTQYDLDLYGNLPLDEAVPLLINDVHVVQLWRDLLDGKFSQLNTNGTVSRAFPYDATAFANMIADPSWPKVRGVITARDRRTKFIQDQICRPFNMGYYINGAGKLVPIDMRLPSALGSPVTLFDTDLDGAQPLSWGHSRSSVITEVEYTYYNEEQQGVELARQDVEMIIPLEVATYTIWVELPNAASSIVKDIANKFRKLYDNPDLGDKLHSVDAKLLRFTKNESSPGGGRKRANIEAELEKAADHLVFPFISGATEIKVRCRRTTNVLSCQVGSWRLLDLDGLPDPATNRRGGVRLVRCVERSEEGVAINLMFLDAGPFITATAPVLGALAQSALTPKHRVTAVCTVNAAGDLMALEYALTATSVGTAPVETSDLWQRAAVLASSGTFIIDNLPSNTRVWVRLRSEPVILVKSPKLPSAWTFSTGTDFVDTAALSPPTAFSVPSPGTTNATAQWTIGDADYGIEVLLDQATSGTWVPQHVAFIPVGSVQYPFEGLTANTIHTAGVRHVDPFGGVSTIALAQFTTAAVTKKCPNMGGITVSAGAP